MCLVPNIVGVVDKTAKVHAMLSRQMLKKPVRPDLLAFVRGIRDSVAKEQDIGHKFSTVQFSNWGAFEPTERMSTYAKSHRFREIASARVALRRCDGASYG